MWTWTILLGNLSIDTNKRNRTLLSCDIPTIEHATLCAIKLTPECVYCDWLSLGSMSLTVSGQTVATISIAALQALGQFSIPFPSLVLPFPSLELSALSSARVKLEIEILTSSDSSTPCACGSIGFYVQQHCSLPSVLINSIVQYIGGHSSNFTIVAQLNKTSPQFPIVNVQKYRTFLTEDVQHVLVLPPKDSQDQDSRYSLFVYSSATLLRLTLGGATFHGCYRTGEGCAYYAEIERAKKNGMIGMIRVIAEIEWFLAYKAGTAAKIERLRSSAAL